MMAPVPPLTVRMPATLQMMSLGEDHLESLPVSCTPITLGACTRRNVGIVKVSLKRGRMQEKVTRLELPGQPCHDIHGVGAAHPDCAGAEAAGIGRMRVGADNQRARKGIIFQHNLHEI